MSKPCFALLVLLSGCVTTSPVRESSLPAGDGCVVALDTTWWGGSFHVGPGSVRGAGLELRTEGDVIVGFLAGRNTRLHVSPERLNGTVGGQPADLKIAHEEDRLVLRGSLGSLGHVVMRSHPARLDFFSEDLSVELNRGERDYRGTAKRFNDYSSPVLRARGCEAMFGEPVLLLAVMAPFFAG